MPKKYRLILLTYCFLLMNNALAQSIQSEADKHHAILQQPSEGVVIAYHADNRAEYASSGKTREGGLLPDEKTIFEIGSITKVFTAILLAEAVRENRAGFDDAVSMHLSDLEFKKNSPFHSITLSELATHTSGLPRLPVDLFDGADKQNPYAHYDEERLQNSLLNFQAKKLDAVGEYSYSNYGFGILGYVVTQIYGQSYRDLLKAKILDPLGMTSTDVLTSFAQLPESTRKRMASPHVAGKLVSHWGLSSLVGAGGMISTAEDLLRFGTAHWDADVPEGLATSMAEVAKPRMEGQGLGWGINATVLGHDGGTGGFRTDLQVDPENQTVRVFLANSAAVSDEMAVEGDFQSMAGYWSGELVSGKKKLRLVFYIDPNGQVALYSIDQSNQAVLSAKSSVVGNEFSAVFPTVPGTYEGTVEDREMRGSWSQGTGDQTVYKLTMTFSEQMPSGLNEILEDTMQGDLASMHGYWWAYIGGEDGLLVYAKITGFGELAVIELYSPDQHNEAIAVDTASLNGRKFKFRSDDVDGRFSGKVSKDGKRIKGLWWQGFPKFVTLNFSDDKPARE